MVLKNECIHWLEFYYLSWQEDSFERLSSIKAQLSWLQWRALFSQESLNNKAFRKSIFPYHCKACHFRTNARAFSKAAQHNVSAAKHEKFIEHFLNSCQHAKAFSTFVTNLLACLIEIKFSHLFCRPDCA